MSPATVEVPTVILFFLEGGKYRPIFLLPGLGADLDCPRCSTPIAISSERIHRHRDRRQTSIDGAVRCATPGCGWDVDIRGGMVYERDLDPWDTRLVRKPRKPITFETMTHEARKDRAMMRRDRGGAL